MSSNVWPVLPGLEPDIEVEDFWGDSEGDGSYEFKTISGKKQVAVTWTADRTVFRVSYHGLRVGVSAPAPYAAYSEVGVVRYLFALFKGKWDTFLFPDPITGSNVQVRFVSTSLKLKREVVSGGAGGQGWYGCSFVIEEDK